MIQRELRIFLASVIFFTKIPCPSWGERSTQYFHEASRYFPLVGWIVGMVGACIIWGGSLIFPLPLVILLSMAATIVLTGALHEDGLADVCDGFGGGWTKEKILGIMKDSSVGVFGVIGVLLVLGLKLLSLNALPRWLLPLTVISGHSVSRFAAISFMYTHPYVREESSSKSRLVVRQMSSGECMFAGILGVVPLIFISLFFSQWGTFLIAGAAVWVTRWTLSRYFSRWIGGYTGDCLGAVQQITEVVFYIALVATAGGAS